MNRPTKRFPEEFGGLQIIAETPEDHPGMSPTAVLGVFIPGRPADLSLDGVRSDFVALAVNLQTSYEVTISDDEMHWGASESVTTVLLFLGQIVLSAAVEEAIRAIANKVAQRGRYSEERELEPEEAEQYALWFTDRTYEDSAPFAVTSRTRDNDAGRWEFTLVSTRVEAIVTVELANGLPVIRVRRTTEFDWARHAEEGNYFRR